MLIPKQTKTKDIVIMIIKMIKPTMVNMNLCLTKKIQEKITINADNLSFK